jgi:hypothetical protein
VSLSWTGLSRAPDPGAGAAPGVAGGKPTDARPAAKSGEGAARRILAADHAFVQNLRRGHYELATDVPARHLLRAAFDQLAPAI